MNDRTAGLRTPVLLLCVLAVCLNLSCERKQQPYLATIMIDQLPDGTVTIALTQIDEQLDATGGRPGSDWICRTMTQTVEGISYCWITAESKEERARVKASAVGAPYVKGGIHVLLENSGPVRLVVTFANLHETGAQTRPVERLLSAGHHSLLIKSPGAESIEGPSRKRCAASSQRVSSTTSRACEGTQLPVDREERDQHTSGGGRE